MQISTRSKALAKSIKLTAREPQTLSGRCIFQPFRVQGDCIADREGGYERLQAEPADTRGFCLRRRCSV